MMDRREFLNYMCALVATTPAAAMASPVRNTAVYAAARRYDFLTTPVYDSIYDPIGENAENIAMELYPNSLQDLVSKGIITSGIKDLSFPLGIRYQHNGGERKRVDFYRGMRDMWNAKPGIKGSRALKSQRDGFLKKIKHEKKSSLREYRRNEIAHGIEVAGEIRKNIDQTYKGEMARFARNAAEKLSSNVLLGYNIHEITPPSYNGRQINPVFKAYFVDRLFKEAGKEFIEGYPARYDPYMSFGPFQMTNFAMPVAAGLNRHVGKEDRIPYNVQDLEGLQDHVNAAVMFALSNFVSLGNHLSGRKLLKKFNDGFEKMDERSQQIVISGTTACMHHQPSITKKRIGFYVDKKPMDDMFYKIRPSLTDQLQKYYDSAAEAYLLMKVFHDLEDKYSRD